MLSDSAFDGIKLIDPAPALGSKVDKGDVDEILKIQKKRSKADCEKASADAKLNPEHVFGADSHLLTNEQVTEAMPLLKEVGEDEHFFTLKLKNYWKRLRPFAGYKGKLTACITEPNDYSYPSGHSSTSMGWALALAELYPTKRADLIKRANEIAEARVVGGVHFPSDIKAGQELGKKVFEKMMQDPNFVKKINELKVKAATPEK